MDQENSYLDHLYYLIGLSLALVAMLKVITMFFFKTYLGMWDGVDEILLKLAIPLYVFQITMQLVLLYWLFKGWRKNVVRKELGNQNRVNGILFFLVLFFDEKGILFVFFVLSMALYLLLLILVAASWKKIEQKSSDLISMFASFLFTILVIWVCLVCL